MKLSDAIQQCLETVYPNFERYMCRALERQGLAEFKPSVMELVTSINGWSLSLLGALLTASAQDGCIQFDPANDEEKLAYVRELYIWWVFDLKRKGL